MKTCITLLSALVILSLFGCSKNEDDHGSVQSEFILEFEDRTISALESDPEPFAFSGMGKSQINGNPDSARIMMRNSLGDLPALDQTRTNTLFVVFNQFSGNGFNNIATEFRGWLIPGERPFVRNGDLEEGIGILWFDENGTLWISGRDIGEFRLDEGDLFPEEVFPGPDEFQKDSKFSILRSKVVMPEFASDFTQSLEMEFNCKLYNRAGESLIIKRATFLTSVNGLRN